MEGSVGLSIMSFFVGFMIGLTSMGGAALMTPFLILGGGLTPAIAVGTDLIYGAVTKWFGSLVHWRQGNIDVKLALRLACGSVPAGALGVLTVAYLQRHNVAVDTYLRRGLGVMLTLVAIIILIRAFIPVSEKREQTRAQGPLTIALGAVVGFAVGLTSIGSGSLMLPVLALLYGLPMARLVGTDVFHAAILVSATGLLHWGAGNVNWGLVPWLLMGSLPGVWMGSRLAAFLPQKMLRVGLALTLLATGVRLV